MLNSLPLIIVMISSLFLAFYCVDSHKENILSTVNMDKKNLEPVSVKIEKNLITEEVKVIDSQEEVYVESLAVEDTNESSKVEDKIENESLSEIVVEKNKPTEMDKKVEREQFIIEQKESVTKVVPVEEEAKVVTEMKSEPAVVEKVQESVKEKVVSEYSEGYKLDDLEKMIMEELKKGNKD
jgi:hypothetical protein